MHSKWFALLGAGLAWGLQAAEQPSLASQKDRISYALGMDIGRNITNRQIEINPDAFAAGLKAIVSGGQPVLNEEQFQEAMKAFQADMQAKHAERAKQQAEVARQQGEKNKKVGEDFLAENKKKTGIVTTASGLQYKVITQGTGPKPTTEDTVIAHYRGTLIDGTEFDSSYRRGEPTEFPVTGVIRGWTEALLLMPVGSKWQLFIPSDLAYGERGAGGQIGPHATLQFDIELVGIKPK